MSIAVARYAAIAAGRTSRSCRPRRAPGRRPRARRASCGAACTRSATAAGCPGAGRSFTVRLTPSTATEPCSTISSASPAAEQGRRARASPAGERLPPIATPSTWPARLAAEPVADPQRALEVHASAGGPSPIVVRPSVVTTAAAVNQRGAKLAHREARAVHRDALAGARSSYRHSMRNSRPASVVATLLDVPTSSTSPVNTYVLEARRWS